MPGGDRTGPRGVGPMTGRRAGYCAGYAVPGYMSLIDDGFGHNVSHGRGRGGGGRGSRHRYFATGLPGWARGSMATGLAALYGRPHGVAAAHDELGILKNQAEYLEEALKDIKQRIQELESSPAAAEK